MDSEGLLELEVEVDVEIPFKHDIAMPGNPSSMATMPMASTISKGSAWLPPARTQTAYSTLVTSSIAPSAAPVIYFVSGQRKYHSLVLNVHREGLICCNTSDISRLQTVGFAGQLRSKQTLAFNSGHGGIKAKNPTGAIRAVSHEERPLSGGGEGAAQSLAGPDKAKAEAPVAEQDSSSTTASTLKVCPVCRHAKLHVDFDKMRNNDLRRDECRACCAVVRSKNSKREMHHLGMSVKQAWLSARKCSACGYIKELRDFGRNARGPQGVTSACRACIAIRSSQNYVKSPVDTPQRCCHCGEVKPADQYSVKKDNKTGRSPVCRECRGKYSRALYAQRKLGYAHLDKEMKTCSNCKMRKHASEFSKHVLMVDGLRNHCNACQAQAARKSRDEA